MRFTKQQQEVFDDLMTVLKARGRAYLLGWLLGMIVSLSTHDPNLRRAIKLKTRDNA